MLDAFGIAGNRYQNDAILVGTKARVDRIIIICLIRSRVESDHHEFVGSINFGGAGQQDLRGAFFKRHGRDLDGAIDARDRQQILARAMKAGIKRAIEVEAGQGNLTQRSGPCRQPVSCC